MNKSANIGARLDRLPNSGWHIKMWLVSAFALLVCWSNGIGGAVQNVLLNELHWLEPAYLAGIRSDVKKVFYCMK